MNRERHYWKIKRVRTLPGLWENGSAFIGDRDAMRKILARTIGLFCLFLAAQALIAAPPVISPGEPWLDTHGNRIQAHSVGITYWNGLYYWFGEDRSQTNDPDKRYVACYSSWDLVHWKFRRQVLVLSDPEHLGPNWVLERPKVFANVHTKKFMMYAHLDDAEYKFARVAVAVSDHIDGEYHYLKSFRPLNQESRDIGQFVDNDGTPYLIFESRPTGGFFIASLSKDYLSVQSQVSFIRTPLEGGALVHYKGLYYVVGSHLTGWNPNPNVYATATSLSGPWSEFKNLAPPQTNTYGAQSSMLLKVVGKKTATIIFMGDIWKPDQLWDSRYMWMPLEIEGSSLMLLPPQKWQLNMNTGETSLTAAPKL